MKIVRLNVKHFLIPNSKEINETPSHIRLAFGPNIVC